MKTHEEITASKTVSVTAAAVLAGLLFVSAGVSRADIVFLNDGSVLTGKVIRSGETEFEFRNSYGTFTIKAAQVRKKHITASYREDIEICRKQNLKLQESDIRRNYEAGEQPAAPEPGLWDTGRISLFGTATKTFGRLSSKLSRGAGVTAAFDHGPDIFFSGRNALVPGLRLEAGYQSFGSGKPSASGASAGAGPLWKAALPGSAGELAAGAVAGASFLKISDRNSSSRSTKFTLFCLGGWEHEFGALSLFVHARYTYIYDNEAPLSGAGLAAGIGYRI